MVFKSQDLPFSHSLLFHSRSRSLPLSLFTLSLSLSLTRSLTLSPALSLFPHMPGIFKKKKNESPENCDDCRLTCVLIVLRFCTLCQQGIVAGRVFALWWSPSWICNFFFFFCQRTDAWSKRSENYCVHNTQNYCNGRPYIHACKHKHKNMQQQRFFFPPFLVCFLTF